MRVHFSARFASGFLVAIAAACGCSGPGAPATDPSAKSSEDKVAVKLVAVAQEEVGRTTVQPATVRPYFQAEIHSKVSGYLKELRADIGDYVEAEAILATVDVPEMEKQRQTLEARVDQNRAEETQAKAGVELAQANVRSAEAKLEQAKAELDRAEATLAAAQAEFDRTDDLVKRQSLENRMLDEARKKRDSEQANKAAVVSAIISAEADVAVAQARLAGAEADLKASEAATAVSRSQLEERNVMIAYASIKAPFAGVITSRSVDPGDLVTDSAGNRSAPLFVLSQIDKVRVHIPVPEVEASLVKKGDSVTLGFPSFPDQPSITATVTRITSSLDPSTRTMLVEAEMPNTKWKLLPGMFGQATITLGAKVATNRLPARAVRFDESGAAYVYAVDDDQVVSVVPVTTGMDDGRNIEIVSGLETGQQVIDAHLQRFVDGQKITALIP